MTGPRKRLAQLLVVLLCVAVGTAFLVERSHKTDPLPPNAQADLVVVEKKAHTLTLFQEGKVLKRYRVALGRGGLKQKAVAGDNRVPEGDFKIVGRNPHSAFHRSLRVGYPSPQQVQQAQLSGVDPGGDIMIHGIRNGLGWLGSMHREVDWTKGCIAVTDREIGEIWRLVPDGTEIRILQ